MINDEITRLLVLYRPLMKALGAAHEQFVNRFPIDYKAHKKASLALKAFADLPCPERAEEYQRLYDASRISQAETFKAQMAMELAILRLDEVGEPLQALEGLRNVVAEFRETGLDLQTHLDELPRSIRCELIGLDSFEEEETRRTDRLHRRLYEAGKRVERFGYRVADLLV